MNIEELLVEDITSDEKQNAIKRIESYSKRYPSKPLDAYIKRLNNNILLDRVKRDLSEKLRTKLRGKDEKTLVAAMSHLCNDKYIPQYSKGNTEPFDTMLDYYSADLENKPLLFNTDFRSCNIAPESVDLIVTDPPYPKQYLPLYKDLAQFAKKVLKPGGSLFAMAGQSYLPEIYNLMDVDGLDYNWTLSYLTPGGQSPQLWQRKVNTFWKPVLWYTKGKNNKWLGDVIKSNTNDNDKRFHHWGQSLSGMIDLIERVSYVGETIVDPFLGGGTTGVAALALDRKFIGIEIETDMFETAKDRLNDSNKIDELRTTYIDSKA